MRFDARYREAVQLSDGTAVELRVLQPADAPLLVEGFESLSDESRYKRFFTAKRSLSDAEVAYLTLLDGIDHFAIGAVTRDAEGREHGAAIARFVRTADDRACAEPAITVIDALQGRGLGSALYERLVAAARERDITRFESLVLPNNLRMRALMRAVTPGSIESLDGGTLRVSIPL